MLERHHLNIIRTIEKTGTLTQAAQKLCLSQPALSHTIKKLEELLGTHIWEKQGRRIRLTQAGHHLYQTAERLLPQFERAEEELKGFALGVRGNLRIGMECHPCYQWLIKNVRPYLAQWPDIDLDVRQQFQFKGIAALYAYEIDLLITPDPILGDGLKFTPVFPYELRLAMHKNHPLAQKEKIHPEDLRKEILFTYPVPTERLDIFQYFLNPAQQTVKQHKTVETTEILIEMLLANRGISALPNWLLQENTATLPITHKRIGEQGIHKHIHIGIREQEQHIQHIQSFLTLINQQNQTTKDPQ